MAAMDSGLTYWAALPADKAALRALDKVRAYRRWFRAVGHAEKARKGWLYANGWTDAGESSVRLQPGGEKGQLIKVVVNGVRPLRQRTMAMVLAGSPEMKPVAANTDAAAREQAVLSKGVLEHVHRVHKRANRDRKVLGLALDMGEGALVIEWDARAGKPVAVDPETQQPAMWEGDLKYWIATALDIYRDTGLRSREDCQWVIARHWVSKYRLAAVYPEHAPRILSVASHRGPEEEDDLFDSRMLGTDASNESDYVAEYVLWHLDAPELEGGREMRFLQDGTVLSDGAYPYDGDMLPTIPLAPEDIAGTSLGYSNQFDALGLSDVLNAIASAASNNVIKGAMPPLMEFEGGNLTKGTPMGTGGLVLKVSRPDLAPKPMELPSTPPEAYKLAEVLERWRMESVGLNETAMGRPPYSGMAAQAMALLDAKADEYNANMRAAWLEYLSAAATFELRILKRYAKEARVAQIAGKAKQWMAKSYNADSLSMVDAVHVEPVGMAARTLAGKFGMLETFQAFGVPLNPEQIVELSQSGQYESDFEAPMANRLRIREENEMLSQGQMPPVLMARPHWTDIQEHLAVIASPDVASKPEVVQATLDTIQAKLDMWRSMPPDLLMLMGGQPPPMAAVPGMPPTGGAPPPPGEVPMPPEPAPGAAQEAIATLDPNAEAPALPEPPPMAA